MLLLCDVLGWSSAEAATLLGSSLASVNSALQRSRETLAKCYPDGQAPIVIAPSPLQRDLLGRYLQAWERLDLDGFVSVLKEDAPYTMPPTPEWYAGRQAIRAFFDWAWKAYAGYRMIPMAANGQPAFAAYSRSRNAPDAPWAAHSIHVLSLVPDSIFTVTLFVKPDSPRLFDAFGLPLLLTEAASAELLSKPRQF